MPTNVGRDPFAGVHAHMKRAFKYDEVLYGPTPCHAIR